MQQQTPLSIYVWQPCASIFRNENANVAVSVFVKTKKCIYSISFTFLLLLFFYFQKKKIKKYVDFDPFPKCLLHGMHVFSIQKFYSNTTNNNDDDNDVVVVVDDNEQVYAVYSITSVLYREQIIRTRIALSIWF